MTMWGKRGFLGRIGLGMLSFCLLCGCDPIPKKVLTPEQKLADMMWLYSQFDENYAPLDYKEKRYAFDFKKVKQDYLQKALGTESNEDFYLVMHQFVALFHDAHTSAILTNGGLPGRVQVAYVGISGKRQGQNFLVTELLPNFSPDASKFPVQVGDEIAKIDGVPLRDVIEKDFLPYENVGNQEANLTYHMNRIFTRISTNNRFPDAKKKDAVLTIVRRDYTPGEVRDLEARERRRVEEGEKKTINVDITVPWLVRDLVSFNYLHAKPNDTSKALSSHPLSGNFARNLIFDLFTMVDDESKQSFTFGFRGFDGALQVTSKVLSKMIPGSDNYDYLDTFYFPNQIEAWTAAVKLDGDGQPVKKTVMATEQFRNSRYIPEKARFITTGDATYPTYVTEEKLWSSDGRELPGSKKVATMYLSTFNPDEPQEKVVEEFKQTLDTLQFYGVSDLVIDLVNNGGGSAALGLKLAQMLSNTKILMPEIQFRLSETWLRTFEVRTMTAPSELEREIASRIYSQLWGEYQVAQMLNVNHRLSAPMSMESMVPFLPGPNEDLKKPFRVVLVVNEMCASMCDVFAATLQDNGMAKVVGNTTMGAGGNVVPHMEAPNSHLILRQTESLIIRKNKAGTYLENNGVTPDYRLNVNEDVSRKYRDVRQVAVDILTQDGRFETMAPVPETPSEVPAETQLVSVKQPELTDQAEQEVPAEPAETPDQGVAPVRPSLF